MGSNRAVASGNVPIGGVWDAHTHLFPVEAARDPQRWGRERGEQRWVEMVAPATGRSLQDFPDVKRMISAMDAAGVERAALLGWYWASAKTCREQNQFLTEVAASCPDRFVPFATVQVHGNKRAIKDLEDAKGWGCRGIGELLPQAQGYSYDDPIFQEVCMFAAESHFPVTIHVTDPLGRMHPGRVETPLRTVLELVTSHPKTVFILAHWGGGLPFFMLNPWVRKELGNNVYFDTAASPLLYDSRVWEICVSLLGAERILFGSDYPLRVFPRWQLEADFIRPLSELTSASFSPDCCSRIANGNFRRLLQEH